MPRNEELHDRLVYVKGLLEQFAALAEECSRLAPGDTWALQELPTREEAWRKYQQTKSRYRPPSRFMAATRTMSAAEWAQYEQRHREKWEASWLRGFENRYAEDLECARAYNEGIERKNAAIERENEVKRQRLAGNVAEMERLYRLFESAIASGWYPPAFCTLEACRYFLFAVDNQLVHSEDELARVYIEELRHRDLMNAMSRQTAAVEEACDRVLGALEAQTQRLDDGLRESAELVREQLAAADMNAMRRMVAQEEAAERRAGVHAEFLGGLYLMHAWHDRDRYRY